MGSRSTLFYFFLCVCLYGLAQVEDDFSDGEFTSQPIWAGNTENFIVNSDEALQLNASGAGSSFLSTPSSLIEKTTWEFYFQLDFNPSGSNYLKVYLVSNQEDLSVPLNGYFVMIGDTPDEISLYRQSGPTAIKIIDGLDKILDQSSVSGYIKVTRDENGSWELTHLLEGSSEFSIEGTVTDLTHTSGDYFGLFCDYTSTRADKFFFDEFRVSQLEVDQVTVTDEAHVLLRFSQAVAMEDAENPLNYTIPGFSIESVSPIAATQVQLELSSLLTSGDYQGSVGSNLTRNDSALFEFSYQALELISLTTKSAFELILTFNSELDTGSAITPSTYSIDHGIGAPLSIEWDEDSQILLTLKEPLVEETSYQLTIDGLQNVTLNSTLNTISNFEFIIPLLLDSAFAISSTCIQLQFNKVLNPDLANQPSNYQLLFDTLIMEIDSVIFEAGTRSVSLFFDNAIPEGRFLINTENLKDVTGIELDMPGNTFPVFYQYLKVIQREQVDENSLYIQFNQPVDSATASNVSNFELTEIGNPSSITYHPLDTAVTLEFEKLYNTDVFLSIRNVNNLTGNAIADVRLAHIFVALRLSTSYRSLLISEFMADPTPAVGLPDAEYVELYNYSPVSIQLEGFLLNDKALPVYLLPANSYVVLTDDSNSNLFEVPNRLSVPTFDVLTNSGETITLSDQFLQVIDQLTYDLGWYNHSDKENGGFSLERINPHQPCSDATNWSASEDPTGGTPGAENSVHSVEPDTRPPSIQDVEVIGGDTLFIWFDEPLEASLESENFSIPGYSIRELRILDYATLYLILDKALESENYYSLSVEGAKDCFGNTAEMNSYKFFHDQSPPILERIVLRSGDELDLVFHEPLLKSEAEKESNFSLESYGIKKALLQDSSLYRVHVTLDSALVQGEIYELSVSGLSDTLGNVVLWDSQEFTFQSAIDTVFSRSNNLLQVGFSKEPDESAFNPDNYQVDTQVGKPIEVVAVPDNELVVYLAFSKNFIENRPLMLYVNDVREQGTSKLMNTPAFSFTMDTKAPSLDSFYVRNDSQLLLTYDEPLDLISATNTRSYWLNGSTEPFSAVAMNNRQVAITFIEKFRSNETYKLSYFGLPDPLGNSQSTTRSFHFVYDKLAPTVQSVTRMNDTTLRVGFSEQVAWAIASQVKNYEVDGICPMSIGILGPDSSMVQLQFEEMQWTTENQLALWNLQDVFGNATDTVSYLFQGIKPQIIRMTPLSAYAVRVELNSALDTSMIDLQNVRLAGFTLTSFTIESQVSFVLNVLEPFTTGDSLNLVLVNLKTGETFSDAKSMWFNSYFEAVVMKDSLTVEVTFSTYFDRPVRQAFMVDSEPVMLALPDGMDQRVIQLVVNKAFPENQIVEVSWQDLKDKWDRRIPDNTANIYRDTQPPELIGIQTDFFCQVTLSFSEDIQGHTKLNVEHFWIQDIGIPKQVKFQADRKVILDFEDQLQPGVDYVLHVNEVADLAGNILEDSIQFTYSIPAVPLYGELLISEIMCDPVPSIGLPENEYVELYNAGARGYNLKSLRLAVGSREIRLPDFILEQGQYVALTVENDYDSSFPKIRVDLPVLPNSGEQVVISTLFGDLVDSISYTREWYGDTEKDDGGYSLELINPFSDCPGVVNWKASTDITGGTPGRQNAVFNLAPDQTAPDAQRLEVINERSVLITFSEVMDSSSLMNALITTTLPAFRNMIDHTSLLIEFEEMIEEGVVYDLSISEATDCAGNEMAPATFAFGRGADPKFHELIITEIMADPEPMVGLPNSEYLELFNRTEMLLSLQNVWYSDSRETIRLPALSIPPKSYLLLAPSSSLSQYDIPNKVAVSNWLSLANAGEPLKLEVDGQLIFQVNYQQDWHEGDAREGGISLEMRDTSNPCSERLNWGSSKHPLGGTSGLPNSIESSVPDRFGPNLVDAVVIDTDKIDLVFDEFLRPDVNESVQLEFSPKIPIAQIQLLNRSVLRVNLTNELPVNEVHQVVVEEVVDCNGNSIRGNKVEFVRGDTADSLQLIINEVLFNPRDGGVDFVELYNHSESFFDLKSWKLARLRGDQLEPEEISKVSRIIGPGEYLALSEDSIVLRTQYPAGVDKRILEMYRFPVFPNEEGTIVLVMPDGRVSDQFTYHEDLHLSLLANVKGVSLERVSFLAPTQDPNNWSSSSASVGFATPGYVNSQSHFSTSTSATLTIEPKVFVPGTANAAESSFTTINYQFGQGGKFANVTIYNQLGQPVVELAKGASLSTSGFLRWDGTGTSGSKVRRGYYVVLFEVYDGSGYQEVLKETVVVGR